MSGTVTEGAGAPGAAELGHPQHGAKLGVLALGALGVVFGDIGTSPLYAFREAFEGHGHELEVLESNVFGVLSLVFWSLVVVISIKYLWLVMRADSDGEGGILTLTSLVTPSREKGRRWMLVLVGLFGTALLYGDGMITPAISVLSAVEGTTIAAPDLEPLVVPIAIVILVGIFAVQRKGTHAVGRIFGPVMVVWFSVLAVLGVIQILQEPRVLQALNPWYGVQFFVDNGLTGVLVLGAVFLVVTGGEALYADMGHFGRRPITLAWFAIALPGLILNYFGQGALLLDDPEAIDNPFFRMAPEWALVPLVVLATMATVIASQALISGAYSLTMQAVQLGYVPRLRIVHTSSAAQGQIYVPAVNWVLMVACIGLVLGFGSSAALAAAYGIAVTATMAITTLLFAVVARTLWEWSLGRVIVVCGLLGIIDLAFLSGNIPKIPAGGWFPIVAGAIIFTLLTTWHTGRGLVRDRIQLGRVPLVTFLKTMDHETTSRVPGTAVYLFSLPGMTPPSLVSNVRYNHVLHERVIVASVVNDDVPRVDPGKRLRHRDLEHGVSRVDVHYGFMEDPDLHRDLAVLDHFDPDDATYFLGKETVVSTGRPGMVKWRERLFGVMGRNATSAADYFRLPQDRIFEIGTRVEIDAMTEWITDVIDALGWLGVGVLVVLENLFPPIPSEVVLPLAGYVAGGGGPSYIGYVIAATIGSVVGAWALYGVAAVFGQDRLHAFVRRYGRWFGVDENEIQRAEHWFDRRADVAVLVGRCVPLVRSLVSLPAGLRRMPLGRFTLLTAIGSAVWNAALIGAGVVLEDQWERVGDVVGVFQLVVIGVILLLVGLYLRKRINAWLDQRRSASRSES